MIDDPKALLLHYAGKFLHELHDEPSWSVANYFVHDDSAGVLEFDHVRNDAGPLRCLPDCAQFLLSNGPKFVIRRKQLPSSDRFAAALHEFKRKLFCAIHFAGEGHIPDHAVRSTMRSQIQRIRCLSTWWPRFSPCTSSALAIFKHFEADAWERFRIQLQRHRPRSNLSAIDRLGLHRPKKIEISRMTRAQR